MVEFVVNDRVIDYVSDSIKFDEDNMYGNIQHEDLRRCALNGLFNWSENDKAKELSRYGTTLFYEEGSKREQFYSNDFKVYLENGIINSIQKYDKRVPAITYSETITELLTRQRNNISINYYYHDGENTSFTFNEIEYPSMQINQSFIRYLNNTHANTVTLTNTSIWSYDKRITKVSLGNFTIHFDRIAMSKDSLVSYAKERDIPRIHLFSDYLFDSDEENFVFITDNLLT